VPRVAVQLDLVVVERLVLSGLPLVERDRILTALGQLVLAERQSSLISARSASASFFGSTERRFGTAHSRGTSGRPTAPVR
jgi:hypothetical protein